MLEQGKTFADAKGDVLRGLQVRLAAVAPQYSRVAAQACLLFI